MMTDERIEEIFGEGCLPEDIYFARAIEAEVTKPQEPVKRIELDTGHALVLDAYPYEAGNWRGDSWRIISEDGAHIRFLDGVENTLAMMLKTTPQPCPKCADGMVVVTKEDANNYCQILTLLGMEEEGSPVEEVKRLISLHEGMTCGDCNDTGWLENREEGRYPCTCMTEAEPYQLLEAERDALAMQNQQYETALRIKNEEHSCCAEDLLEARKDSERLEWLMRNVSGKEFRRLGVHYGGNCGRDRIDAAMNAENPEWQNAVQAAFGGIGQTPQG